MKKLTLFLVATLFSALSFAALNPYAYGLSSSREGTTLKVNYSLNAPATAVSVVIMDGETEVKTIACDGKTTKASHTVEISTLDLPTGKLLTWKVVVSGNEVTIPTAISGYRLYHPASVDIDNNTESPHFGRILATEAMQSVASKTDTYLTAGFGAGIIEFNAAFEHLPNGEKVGYTGGKTFVTTSNHFAPRRIRISKDGRIFATAQDNSGEYLWEINPDNLDSWTSVFQGTKSDFTLKDGSGNFIAGTNSGFDVRGTGENLQLLMLSANKPGAQVATFKLHEYNLGDATSWSTVPTRELSGCQLHNSMITNQSQVQYDNEGGYWITYWVNTTNSNNYGGIAHFKKDGTRDFIKQKINLRNAGFRFNHDFTKVIIATNDVTGASKIYKQATVYAVSKDVNGAPVLTKETTIDMTTVGNNLNDFAWDYADNIYVVGNSAEWIYAYALPHSADKIVSTPCASKYAFEVEEIVANVYTLTTNVVGEGTIEGNDGSYVEGTTATLTATPAAHYDFVNWTGDVTSTDNPLTITVDGNKNITANFAKKQYTLTVLANDAAKGDVTGNGTYEYGTAVQITATPKPGYEFAGWSNGSKDNPLTITIEEDIELTAHFRAILASSITLNAHPVQDYSASIVGTMKRAIQNGENTIVLTHEANGTAHIYNIAHTTKTITEISQEGVHAAADGFLSISDIALTEDGKLVACNSAQCTYTPSGTTYFYIWNDLAGNPEEWFTSQSSANYTTAIVGGTMALKGTSSNAEVVALAITTGATKAVRYVRHIVNGNNITTKYSKTGTDSSTETLYSPVVGTTYELNASPLANMNWLVDGELVAPIEIIIKADNNTFASINTNLSEAILGKKYNGASYLFHNDHHLMIAPYAGADDKLAGVKVLGISDGFGSAVEVTTSTNLASAINAEAAAATAYVDGDGDLTIYLFADSKVFTFSEKVYTAQTFTVTATAGEGGSVEGGGTYEEGATATVTATANEHYDFVNWTEDEEVVSTTAEYSFTVTKDIELTANFQEHAKYTITAHATDNTMGYVTGSGTYYAGESVTLKAVANSTYSFVNWSDGNTDAIRTFTATADVTLTANFAKASPRAWAYDLKMVEDGDNYKFSFNATTAANATLLFLDKEGNELYTAHEVGAVAAGANTVSIEKAYFTQVKDVYWAVKMDGEAISHVAEITDQSRNIYDFYNMQGVVVDNDPNSEKFGEIYIEMAKSGTTNSKAQTLGLFLLNQNLDVLNDNPNKGIIPTMPSEYALDGTNYTFQRLNIDPTTGKLVFSYGISSKPAVFAIDRENMTGNVTNLLDGITGLTKTVAHCFDAEGTLYVMDIASSKGTIYKIKDGIKTVFAATTGRFVSSNITMAADGRGGLWVAQYRGQMDSYYQLVHFNDAGTADFSVYDDKGTYNATNGTVGVSSTGFTGHSYRGALAYDVERQILAQGRNSTVEVFQVAYDATTGVPTLIKIATTPQVNKANIDGLAFDYAGDLYVVNSGTEKFYKYTLPTAENICTVPAPESQAIIKEVRYTVTVNTVGNGTATGAGEYVAGETATLEATPAANHNFVNWTYGSETSTDNPLSLVVNSDITVTANFAAVQYTLIAPTNDENKGTVTGAGTYAHGTEVTLEATPKAGYKLLYWSDRSKENPRTITMTKNEAISAYFVKDYAEEPTFSIEKVWENTNVPASTSNGYQAVGWDGKIYVKERGNDKITVYLDATTSKDYAQTDNADDQSIAVDNAGNLVLRSGSTNFYDAPTQIILYKKGETTYKTIDFTLPETGRCDFISASGDLFSAEGGYVYFYCQNKTGVSRLCVKNGGATAADVTVDYVGNITTGGNTQSHVMADIFGNLVTHSRTYAITTTINAHTGETMNFTLPNNHKANALGGCSFELAGKEFWAFNVKGTNTCTSEWNLYNLTDGAFVSPDILYAKNKTDKNSAANWLNVQVVDENTAYIYQFCPTVAMAVWKVSIQRDDLQEYTVTATANDASMGSVTGGGTYYEGATAILAADANTGYRFVNWTKDETILSTDARFTYTVPAENVTIVANFEEIPAPRAITYELNGGQYNQYGWENKGDICLALEADYNATYGTSKDWVQKVDGVIQYNINGTWMSEEEAKGKAATVTGFLQASTYNTTDNLKNLVETTMVDKYGWLKDVIEANRTAQSVAGELSEAIYRKELSAFFLCSPAHSSWPASSSHEAMGDVAAFQSYWGQSFPNPTHPNSTVTLNAPYKEGYLFDGWYTTSDFTGSEVTTVDETTNGTLYAKWLEHFYTRTVNSGRYGTICLPYGSTNMTGATFYEVAWMNTAVSPWQVYVDEVTELEAGKPYIFMANSNLIKVVYQGEEALSAGNYNGLYGTFVDIIDGEAGAAGNVLENNHMLSNNQIMKCLGKCQLPANRAYFKLDEIRTTEPSLVPGRRRVALGVQGGNEATGFDNLTEDGPIAPNAEGTYDVLGRKFSEPTGTGFYIVNGKKVVIVK